MTEERKSELLNEMLGWVSEMYRGYELYEFARNRGMTDNEILSEFYFDNAADVTEYRKQYNKEYCLD